MPGRERWPVIGDLPVPAGPVGADLEFRSWLVDEIFEPLVRQAFDETSPLDDLEEPANR